MSSKLPIVTIVGRQNVGKSTLFNAIIREKKSIVDSHPGLTRDIISYELTLKDTSFIISDTPGLDISDLSELSQSILDMARKHLERSSLIVFLMENPSPSSFDMELADIIRKTSLPVIIAVNKMDSNSDMENMINFYEMGFSDILPVSALKYRNIPLLLEKISGMLPASKGRKSEAEMKIAIVGRPNSGKSTLLNSLLGYERSVVSDVPGTTRDSVDEDFQFHGKRIKVIDTAGLRRRSRVDTNVEFYSIRRTVESISKSDVVIHLLDATVGLTETDKKISDEIMKARKPTIIAVNKWDSIPKDTKTFEQYRDRIVFKFYKASDFPIISISARNKQRIHKLLTDALEIHQRSGRKIETSTVNKILEKIQNTHQMPLLGDKLKIYYATQTATTPPRFKLFVNNPELFRADVIRFLEKSLQKELDMHGIPVVLDIEGRKKG